MDNYLTPSEVAKGLKVHRRTVINMIQKGILKAVIVSGEKRKTYRIWEKELDRFMSENYERYEKDE